MGTFTDLGSAMFAVRKIYLLHMVLYVVVPGGGYFSSPQNIIDLPLSHTLFLFC